MAPCIRQHPGRMILGVLAGALLALSPCFGRSLPGAASPKDIPKEDLITPKPLLRINIPMHRAAIRRIGTDAGRRWIVTASKDKSVRLWDAGTGNWLKTFRLPSEPGNVGKAYSAAISPDGRHIAAGGFTGRYVGQINIYFFDRETGQIIHRIPGLPSSVNHLAYSRDGRFLAACLGGRNGIRIYRTGDYSLAKKDDSYGERSYWADFDNKGRLVTTCFDGKVRLYDSDFKETARFDTKGKTPFGADFSRDGSRIAVGYFQSPVVDILDGHTLEHLYAANPSGVDNGDLGIVAWSGTRLYAGGSFKNGSGRSLVIWDNQGRKAPDTLQVADNRIMGILPLSTGELVIASAEPALVRLDPNANTVRWRHTQQQADFRRQIGGYGIRLSADAGRIRFGFRKYGKSPAGFDLKALALEPGMGREGLTGPDEKGLEVTGWKDGNTPELKGRKLWLKDWEKSRSLAIAPDRRSFVLGTEWNLRWFDAGGKPIGKPVALPGVAWAVNISRDGRWLVAGLSDGTLRWYDYASHGEKLALFVRPDDHAWVIWTPEGYYACSPGAEELVGYQLNQGLDHAPGFVSGGQIYELFARRDLVLAKFRGDQAAIDRALARTGDVRRLLMAVRPPELGLARPVPKIVAGTKLTVPLRIRDRGSGIGRIEVLVNGILQPGKNLTLPDSLGNMIVHLDLPPEQESRVEIRASSAQDRDKGGVYSTPLAFPVRSRQPAPERKPALHCLAIGIENYRESSLALKFAIDDVLALQNCLYTHSRPLFETVQVTPLVDPGKAAILDGFKDMLKKKINKEDLFILYLSGHGIAMDGNFYFLPSDFLFRDEAALKEDAVTQKDLVDFISSVPASKLVVIIDACYAGSARPAFKDFLAYNTKGAADKTAMIRLAKTTGRAVFYGAGDQNTAVEGYKKKSLYTGVMLEGLSGLASYGDDRITLSELKVYLDDYVPRVSKRLFGREIIPLAAINASQPITISIVP